MSFPVNFFVLIASLNLLKWVSKGLVKIVKILIITGLFLKVKHLLL